MQRTISLSKSFRFGLALCLTGLLIIQLILPVQGARAGPPSTTTALSSSLNPSIFGREVVFRATITRPVDGGTVTFQDGGENIPGCVVVSVQVGPETEANCVTSPLTVGAHIITAQYSGDTKFAGSTGTLTPDQQVNSCTSPITVTSNADDGAGSLRQAINNVCADGKITFGGDYTISLLSDLPDLAQNLTIDGIGHHVTIEGVPEVVEDCVFHILLGATVTLNDLTITGGHADNGGAINNAGTLTVSNSTLSGNYSSGDGGGIYNDGTLTVTDSTISGNTASAHGGGIANAGHLTISKSTISGNTYSSAGGGIFNGSDLTVTNSIITGNAPPKASETDSRGGGIYNNYIDSTLKLSGSSVSNNTAYDGGGLVNDADSDTGTFGTVDIADTTFTGNTAEYYGAGIVNYGHLTLTGSTLTGNTAVQAGGGIANDGTMTVVNSTLQGNTATDPNSQAGGMYNDGTLNLFNSTLAGNAAAQYNGFYNTGGHSILSFANTILSGASTGGVCGIDLGTLSQNLNNLVSDGTCSTLNGSPAPGFKTGDPLLAPLADNSGPTQTMALLPGSVAINLGDYATCTSDPVNGLDQRGVSRTDLSSKCDSGAYEYNPPAAFSKTAPGNTATNQPLDLHLTWSASAGADEYDLCFGTANPCTNWVKQTGLVTDVEESGLSRNTAYYWNVCAARQGSIIYANASETDWSFTTQGGFIKTNPSNGATGLAANVSLTWSANPSGGTYWYCYDAINDNNCFNWSNAGSSTSASLVGLPPNTTYYWQVKAVVGSTTVYADGAKANFFSFKTGSYPGLFGKLAPVKGSVGQPLSLTLIWSASSNAPTYYYCVDTASGCTSWVSNGTATSVSLSGLLPNTTYYWQVKAVNAVDTTYANIFPSTYWSFTTGSLPKAFNKSSPGNPTAGVPSSVTLKWGSSSSAMSYWVCYDTTNDGACSNWASAGLATSKTISGLLPATTYYWQVKALNLVGTTYADGKLTAFWSFTTGAAPGAFGKIGPANQLTGQNYSLTLSWGTSVGATRYEFCYGRTNPCTNWVSVGTATSKLLSGLLAKSTYYWQVRAVNANGITYANATTTDWWFKTK